MQQLQTLFAGFGWKESIAVLALVVSCVTAYLTLLRKAILTIRIGKTILVVTEGDGMLSLAPEISVLNEGAKTAVIYHIDGSMTRLADEDREPLNWIENLATVTNPNAVGTRTIFDGFPETIFISRLNAVKQRLLLRTKHALTMQLGDYELGLRIRSQGASKGEIYLRAKIRIQAADLEFFERNRQPSGSERNSRRFILQHGPNTECYIGTSNPVSAMPPPAAKPAGHSASL